MDQGATTARTSVPERWLPGARRQPSRNAVRLFCFPFAGGGASAYGAWQDGESDLEVQPIQYPARETRWKDPAFGTFAELIAGIADDLAPHWNGTFAFWGHSFGAAVAFEVARKLRARGAALPCHLFVSGAQAPHLPMRERIHDLPPRDFLRKLVAYHGIPREVLASRELLGIVLPIVQHDFRLLEEHTFEEEEPLPVPLSAFGGMKDESIKLDEVLAWSVHTSSTFRPRFVGGDHFFPFTSAEAMRQHLRDDLALSTRLQSEVPA